MIITRRNDRRLRIAATDWVKNGDRWTALHVAQDAALKVRHTRNGRTAILPAGYVPTATELGYATTVHGAQGVTVDTMHGVVTGHESRQQLYTMLTRGRTANHLYLPVVGDGDPHTILRPREHLRPHLHVAAEHVADPQMINELDHDTNGSISGLNREAAWPALRARLLLLMADGADPLSELPNAAQQLELDTTSDRAAVLDWRLDDTRLHNKLAPLPWLPGLPDRIANNPDWGPYLAARAQLIADLADQVCASGEAAPGRTNKIAHCRLA